MLTLLVVEDDTTMARGLAHNLEFDGYQVLNARDAEAGLELLEKQSIDLIVLDLMLPGMSGFDLCRTLRAKGINTPIIMLTARGQETDRVLGLELGADDYITKPFSIRELLARIKAVLRRSDAAEADLEHFSFGEIKLDFQRFEARAGANQIHLSPKEFALLKFLIQNQGRAVPRSELLGRVWGYDAYPLTRTVDNHIAGLRAKLEDDPTRPDHLLTVHGIGYKFVAEKSS